MPDALPTSITTAIRALESLGPAARGLIPDESLERIVHDAEARGYFRPDEDVALRAWFSRYLTVRAGLHGTIRELRPIALAPPAPEDRVQLIGFTLAYTAAATLVAMARVLVERSQASPTVRRKLDEACPEYRIPRKQCSTIYGALTSPRTAWRLRQGIELADARRADIEALRNDPRLAPVVELLAVMEPALRMRARDYVKARLRYRIFSWRRRRSSALQQGLFALFEGSGRVIADLRYARGRPKLRPVKRRKLAALLEPGDVIVTRHDHAVSNLFLPGYWPHASLHVGPGDLATRLPRPLDGERCAKWIEPRRVLEARKDGVRLRELNDTLSVDAVAVIRPQLDAADVLLAIRNALEHEGKPYNFDFDFFTADRLVCTEVPYRAYEGVGGISFPLATRAGRLTLSAEDVLDMAMLDRGFAVVATYGIPGTGRRVLTGEKARAALARSYEVGGAGT